MTEELGRSKLSTGMSSVVIGSTSQHYAGYPAPGDAPTPTTLDDRSSLLQQQQEEREDKKLSDQLHQSHFFQQQPTKCLVYPRGLPMEINLVPAAGLYLDAVNIPIESLSYPVWRVRFSCNESSGRLRKVFESNAHGLSLFGLSPEHFPRVRENRKLLRLWLEPTETDARANLARFIIGSRRPYYEWPGYYCHIHGETRGKGQGTTFVARVFSALERVFLSYSPDGLPLATLHAFTNLHPVFLDAPEGSNKGVKVHLNISLSKFSKYLEGSTLNAELKSALSTPVEHKLDGKRHQPSSQGGRMSSFQNMGSIGGGDWVAASLSSFNSFDGGGCSPFPTLQTRSQSIPYTAVAANAQTRESFAQAPFRSQHSSAPYLPGLWENMPRSISLGSSHSFDVDQQHPPPQPSFSPFAAYFPPVFPPLHARSMSGELSADGSFYKGAGRQYTHSPVEASGGFIPSIKPPQAPFNLEAKPESFPKHYATPPSMDIGSSPLAGIESIGGGGGGDYLRQHHSLSLTSLDGIDGDINRGSMGDETMSGAPPIINPRPPSNPSFSHSGNNPGMAVFPHMAVPNASVIRDGADKAATSLQNSDMSSLQALSKVSSGMGGERQTRSPQLAQPNIIYSYFGDQNR